MSKSNTDAPAEAAVTAQYIAKTTRELREMASAAGLDFISYLLAMAEEEAFTAVVRDEKALPAGTARRGSQPDSETR